jgi:hypothetical protein
VSHISNHKQRIPHWGVVLFGGWPTLSSLVPGDAPPLSRLLCDRVGGKQNA